MFRKKRQTRRAASRRPLVGEPLEARQLLACGLFAIGFENGVLSIEGTNENDTIQVAQQGSAIVIDASNSCDSLHQVLQIAPTSISVNGADGHDTINVELAIPASIYGGLGDDVISGGGGDDSINGGLGDDVITGGDGSDRIDGSYDNDILTGGSGDDRLVGGPGDDWIDGGVGSDTIYAYEDPELLYFDEVYDDDDEIFGGWGSDDIYAGPGNDVVYGDTGVDAPVPAGSHDDLIYGGAGIDRIFAESGKDTVYGGSDNDLLDGGDANDRLYGEEGNDLLIGGRGFDYLYGQEGNDRLYGGKGNDCLFGGVGFDQGRGGRGNDHLHSIANKGPKLPKAIDDFDDENGLPGSSTLEFWHLQRAIEDEELN